MKAGRKREGKRDSGSFLAFPHVALRSVAYRNLGHVARSLLVDIALQYSGGNNGKLTASMKYLRPLGWKSADTLTRAKTDLLKSGLLIETRKGARPNKAAWYMLAWHELDNATGLDSEPGTYQRMRREYHQAGANGAGLIPSDGIAMKRIAPSNGVRDLRPIPSGGAIRAN